MKLEKILSYKRRDGSEQHAAFLTALSTWLDKSATKNGADFDVLGDKEKVHALMYSVPGSGAPVVWTCHTDTVHALSECSGSRPTNKVEFDKNTGTYHAVGGSVLGADCGAGVYVLCRMISAGVPGVYLFFTGEEVGGIGSAWLAKNHKAWLSSFKVAVSFDRRGVSDVVYEQGIGICASKSFANDFGAMLNRAGFGLSYSPSNMGSFTDSANLAGIIPECLNVSIGYECEHSSQESLDSIHLEKLILALIEVFTVSDIWAILEKSVSRKAGEFGNYSDRRGAPYYESLVDIDAVDVASLPDDDLFSLVDEYLKEWAKARILSKKSADRKTRELADFIRGLSLGSVDFGDYEKVDDCE